MLYSPKLKRVMKQLREIVEIEGVGASIIIHEPGFSENLMHINPRYSCAHIDNGSYQLRIRAKREDYTSLEAQKKAITDTVNMFVHLRDMSARQSMMFEKALEIMSTKVDITNIGGTETSQTQLDN